MNITKLQDSFAKYLLHQSVDLEELNIVGPFSAQQLMNLYRNNFYISITEYLEACFPSVKALVGEQFFSQLAKAFIIQEPLASASIELYGEKFAKFIQHCEQAKSLPYLYDIAHLDWVLDRAKSVVEYTDFPFAQLQQVSAQEQLKIRFQLQPNTVLINARCPLLKIWHGIKSGELESIDIQQQELVIVHPDKEEGVKCYNISQNQYDFLSAVANGNCLEELAAVDDFQQQLQYFISTAVINNFI
ncbi:MAG: DNA-binding domain-containing protein [Oceanospirillaceae bacterium]